MVDEGMRRLQHKDLSFFLLELTYRGFANSGRGSPVNPPYAVSIFPLSQPVKITLHWTSLIVVRGAAATRVHDFVPPTPHQGENTGIDNDCRLFVLGDCRSGKREREMGDDS